MSGIVRQYYDAAQHCATPLHFTYYLNTCYLFTLLNYNFKLINTSFEIRFYTTKLVTKYYNLEYEI